MLRIAPASHISQALRSGPDSLRQHERAPCTAAHCVGSALARTYSPALAVATLSLEAERSTGPRARRDGSAGICAVLGALLLHGRNESGSVGDSLACHPNAPLASGLELNQPHSAGPQLVEAACQAQRWQLAARLTLRGATLEALLAASLCVSRCPSLHDCKPCPHANRSPPACPPLLPRPGMQAPPSPAAAPPALRTLERQPCPTPAEFCPLPRPMCRVHLLCEAPLSLVLRPQPRLLAGPLPGRRGQGRRHQLLL